ncbi:DMT family transporter [Oceanobacillus timonensis]|uniref:DMT family transporter n=1 Tax=Oceanobacillus timonensis TaxID=1926285 RepID=UPI0009BBFB96|nr:multidrug efflux SMR transporter [Oceanobacillus timonensis]
MYYVILILSILFEVSAATFMKLSEGFTSFIPSMIVIISYFLALTLYIWLTKIKELGIINALWSGGGTILITISGVSLFNETISFIKILGVLLIVLGIIGLNLPRKYNNALKQLIFKRGE